MAVFAGCAGNGNGGIFCIGFAKGNYAVVWVMANNTINDNMLALEELFVLFVVLNEGSFGIDSFLAVAPVAITASIAGAIHFHGADGGTLTNVTISGNSAEDTGGGLWSDSAITVINSTITLNDAPNGGGIVNSGGTVDISNTIVAENLASTDPDVEGTFNSQGYNLIGDKGTVTNFTHGGDQAANSEE